MTCGGTQQYSQSAVWHMEETTIIIIPEHKTGSSFGHRIQRQRMRKHSERIKWVNNFCEQTLGTVHQR